MTETAPAPRVQARGAVPSLHVADLTRICGGCGYEVVEIRRLDHCPMCGSSVVAPAVESAA